MKRASRFFLGGLLSYLPLACTTSTKPSPEPEVIAPHRTVEAYRFEYFGGTPTVQTRLFTYLKSKDGYSLMDNATRRTIKRTIPYQKTFGGDVPFVEIQLLNSRFILFPETLNDSEVQNTIFHDMHAVTHVYDLKRHRLLTSSPPYQYNHNVPLKYDLTQLPAE